MWCAQVTGLAEKGTAGAGYPGPLLPVESRALTGWCLLGHGTCDTQWICHCMAPFTGPACVNCLTGFSGTACDMTCPMSNGTACSDHGQCLDGVCFCDAGYCGRSCNSTATLLQSGSFECPQSCPSGYYGLSCSSSCSGTIFHANTTTTTTTTEVCSGHGQCDDGVHGTGLCRCEEGYGGLGCTLMCPRLILSDMQNSAMVGAAICSGHGTCDGGTAPGRCDRNVAGPACNMRCPFATTTGSVLGHGTPEGAHGRSLHLD